MPEAYRLLTSSSVLRTADEAVIPNDAENTDYQVYLEWVALGNTPDPAVAETLTAARIRGKRVVDQEFERRMAGILPSGAATVGFAQARIVQEALDIASDGAPTAANYPLLDGLVQAGEYADLVAAGAALRTWWDGVKVTTGDHEAVRRTAHVDIDAAADVPGVDAILAAVTWP